MGVRFKVIVLCVCCRVLRVGGWGCRPYRLLFPHVAEIWFGFAKPFLLRGGQFKISKIYKFQRVFSIRTNRWIWGILVAVSDVDYDYCVSIRNMSRFHFMGMM